MFYDLPNVFPFVDDILIVSKTFEEHVLHVQTVLERLTEAKLTINEGKCKFVLKQVSVLGHTISKEGIQIDFSKLDRVHNWPTPTTGKDIQSFLGLMNYFFDFIPKFSELAHPLNELRNENSLENLWNDECENSFQSLKHCLFHAPLLSAPNFNEPFFLATDASAYAAGGVLFQAIQGFDFQKKQQQNVKYIKFYSHSLSKAERNYSASKRELFAVVCCLKKFANYLNGVHFTIISDHEPLSHYNTQDNLSTLHSRWLDTLLDFDFEIRYYPGRFNILPDLLSRVFPDASERSKQTLVLAISSTDDTNFTASTEGEFTREEKIAISIGKQIPNETERENLLSLNHSISHCGAKALYKKLWNMDYYWLNMKNDCEKTCANCDSCQKFSITQKGFNPQCSIFASLPMDHIAIDTLGPLPTSQEGKKYILVAIDVFTRFVFLRALTDKTALSVAKELFNICCEFGHPQIIQSDNGTEFVNEVIEHLTLLYHWDHRLSTPYYPQGNGLAESAVKSCLTLVRKRFADEPTNWSTMLASIQVGINQSINSLHGSSPFSLMFARALNGFNNFADVQFQPLSAEEVSKRIQFINDVLFTSIQQRSSDTIAKRNKYWNSKSHIVKALEPGSIVMARIPGKRPKLRPPFVGPYRVVRRTLGGTYLIADANGTILPRGFQISQLKPIIAQTLTNEFYAEAILDDKQEPDGSQKFKVRWFGYGPEHDSWEPKENFNDESIINNYLEEKDLRSHLEESDVAVAKQH